MFFCGSKCFGDEENGAKNRPAKKGNKLRRSTGKSSSKKNPYAELGLEKFHALLADVEEKKQKIYKQYGAEEISSNDDADHATPIIARFKGKGGKLKLLINDVTACSVEAAADAELDGKSCGEIIRSGRKEEAVVKMRRSYCCVGVMVVLILVFLAIYGRSFAIICATIAWYLVGGSSGGRKII